MPFLPVSVKTKFAFEGAMRSSKFASLDAARKSVASSPMLPDYIIDHLCEIGVLAVLSDGSVAGVQNTPQTRAGKKRPNISTDWKSTWPPESALLDAMQEPIKFRELQEVLAAGGHASGHWFCLHAIWALEKRGLVRKDGKEYVAVNAAKVAVKAQAVDLDDGVEGEAWGRMQDMICEMGNAPGLKAYYTSKILKLIDERFGSDGSDRCDEWCEAVLNDMIADGRIPSLPIRT